MACVNQDVKLKLAGVELSQVFKRHHFDKDGFCTRCFVEKGGGERVVLSSDMPEAAGYGTI